MDLEQHSTQHIPNNITRMMILSQKAKELAQYNNKYIPIFNCRLYQQNVQINSHNKLADFIKLVKNATMSNVQQRAVIQDVCLHSFSDNAILSSILHSFSNQQSILLQQNGAAAVASKTVDGLAEIFDRNAELKAKVSTLISKSYPLIVSSIWNERNIQSNYSISLTAKTNNVHSEGIPIFNGELELKKGINYPFSYFNTMNFHWIPRYQCVDIVGTTAASLQSPHSNQNFSSMTTSESCGVLYEELESCLIWTMNAFRLLIKTNLTSAIKNRFKYAKKLETRLTSGILACYRLCLYAECKEKEDRLWLQSTLFSGSNIPTVAAVQWSKCVEPISLWQLSNLMLHCSNIITKPEDVLIEADSYWHDGHKLLEHTDFKHGISSCTNTFLTFLGSIYQEEKDQKVVGSGRRNSVKHTKPAEPEAHSDKFMNSSNKLPGTTQASGNSVANIMKRRMSMFPDNGMQSAQGGINSNPQQTNYMIPTPPEGIKSSIAAAATVNHSNSSTNRNPFQTPTPAVPARTPSHDKISSQDQFKHTYNALIQSMDIRTVASAKISDKAAIPHIDHLETLPPIKNRKRLNSMIGLLVEQITRVVLNEPEESIRMESGLSATQSKVKGVAPVNTTGVKTNRPSIALGFTGNDIASGNKSSRHASITSAIASNVVYERPVLAIQSDTGIQASDCNITIGSLSENETIMAISRWVLDGMYQSHTVPAPPPSAMNANAADKVHTAPIVVPRMSLMRKNEVLSKLRKTLIKNVKNEHAATNGMGSIVSDATNGRIISLQVKT